MSTAETSATNSGAPSAATTAGPKASVAAMFHARCTRPTWLSGLVRSVHHRPRAVFSSESVKCSNMTRCGSSHHSTNTSALSPTSAWIGAGAARNASLPETIVDLTSSTNGFSRSE